MEEFPGNSNLAKQRQRQVAAQPEAPEEPKPHVKKVVEGKVVMRKKPLGRKIKETLFGGDSRGVVSYLFGEVLVPAAQDMIVDMVTQGIERVIFPDGGGNPSRRRRNTGRGRNNNTDYQSPFGSRNRPIFNTTRVDPREEQRRPRRSSSATFDLDELLIPSYHEAQQVLVAMDALIGKYGRCTVNELYDLCGETGPWTGESYGWEDISGARPRRDRGGSYWLDLPRPEELR